MPTKEQERAELRQRRHDLFKEIRDFEADRREKLEKVHQKQQQDPEDEKKAAALDREIRRILDSVDELEEKLPDRRERRQKVTKKLKAVRKEIKKANSTGPHMAIQWALSVVGTTENPYGSNWGVPVQDWIQRCGYTYAVPWCGAFAREAIVDHGGAEIPDDNRFGYAGYIVEDARAHRNGLIEVAFEQAQPGDVLVFWGSAHIGICRETPSSESISTIEGNTSSGLSGSQSNGGGVYARTRTRSDVTCVARPAYS